MMFVKISRQPDSRYSASIGRDSILRRINLSNFVNTNISIASLKLNVFGECFYMESCSYIHNFLLEISYKLRKNQL